MTTDPCRYCGKEHGPRCPEVRAIEYHPDGTVKRVEFLTPADHHPMPLPMPPYGPAGDAPWAAPPVVTRASTFSPFWNGIGSAAPMPGPMHDHTTYRI